jgi:phosphoglycolate phosphatase
MPAPLRCVYCDLDETLLGAGAAFLRGGDGEFSLLGARALEACDRADVEFVIYSGRRRSSLWHDARILGVGSYAFEAGAGLVIDGELHWLTGAYAPTGDRTVFEQIEASGAPALLLERFELVYHDPWHQDREVSHLFRGSADTDVADAILRAAGHGDLRLLDNGASDRPGARVYHLVPREASKSNAVAFHMRTRGYAPDECIAIGDSREDMGAAEAVGAFWLVANADEALLATSPHNTRACEEAYGAGVYEAVMTELAERRS